MSNSCKVDNQIAYMCYEVLESLNKIYFHLYNSMVDGDKNQHFGEINLL